SKYGEEAFKFEILEEVHPADLDMKEQEWIDKLQPVLNTTLTVYGNTRGVKLSEEHKARLGDSKKGQPKSQEHKDKLSAAQKGITRKPLSEEHKAKMSAALRG